MVFELRHLHTIASEQDMVSVTPTGAYKQAASAVGTRSTAITSSSEHESIIDGNINGN